MARWRKPENLAEDLPRIAQNLTEQSPESLQEFIPGAQTILLCFNQPTARKTASNMIQSAAKPAQAHLPARRLIKIPVYYTGSDLNALAQAKSLSEQEIIQRHSSPVYTVEFMGFSPGFPYLGPLDTSLHTPRKASPRQRIEPGSVAIGGSHTGIYSVASPGGWHIIGKTSLPLFYAERARTNCPDPNDVFLLQPGDRIKFISIPAKPV
jgi:KipI family sensor histidine kinase inhibitor